MKCDWLDRISEVIKVDPCLNSSNKSSKVSHVLWLDITHEAEKKKKKNYSATMHITQPGAYVRIIYETKEKLLLPVEITEHAEMSRS